MGGYHNKEQAARGGSGSINSKQKQANNGICPFRLSRRSAVGRAARILYPQRTKYGGIDE
jgi:hypothetical protein